MAYLDEHPPKSPQFRFPRREAISGIVFIHTAESVMDTIGPDTGAENVAAFISNRSDPGSYHVLVDSDSTINVVRDDCEAFQVAANGHNRHGFGVSFACRTTDMHPDRPWTRAAMRRAADAILAFWARQGIDPNRAAFFIPRSDVDARRGPGLCTHGDVQPGDRSDAWTTHPHRGALEAMLLGMLRSEPEEDDMATAAEEILARLDDIQRRMKGDDGKGGFEADIRATNAAVGRIEVGVLDPTGGVLARLANMPVDQIVEVIPDDVAEAVWDKLAEKLGKK